MVFRNKREVNLWKTKNRPESADPVWKSRAGGRRLSSVTMGYSRRVRSVLPYFGQKCTRHLYLTAMKALRELIRPANRLVLCLHFAGWTLYGIVIFYMAAYHGIPVLLAHPGVHLLGQVAIFYANYSYLVPRLLGRAQTGRFLWTNLGCVLLLESLTIEGYHVISRLYPSELRPERTLPYHEQFVLRFFELVFFVILAAIVRFTKDWFVHQQEARESENNRLRSELAMLKAQIQPHFLFNSLNSLYALSLRQAPETPQSILHLAGLMRYMLYESADGQISLEKEIDVIGRYLDLQKLRLPPGYEMQFYVEGDPSSVRLEPLLLLPVIENIFKHGENPISIGLRVFERQLSLHTCNRINGRKTDLPGGIGLANLLKRLNYLYPDRHKLLLKEQDGRFLVTLIIDL